MVKYTVMKFLVIALAFLTSSAYAAKNVLPRPGDEGYADSEASTNEVFAVGAMSEKSERGLSPGVVKRPRSFDKMNEKMRLFWQTMGFALIS